MYTLVFGILKFSEVNNIPIVKKIKHIRSLSAHEKTKKMLINRLGHV